MWIKPLFNHTSHLISSDYAERAGFSICKEFIGHGIGSYFHGLPEVYHYSNSHGPTLRPGMVFTIGSFLFPTPLSFNELATFLA